jgi:hypothetical protein
MKSIYTIDSKFASIGLNTPDTGLTMQHSENHCAPGPFSAGHLRAFEAVART